MAKVLGVGGVFFKTADPATLTAWYRRVLGLEVEAWGGVVFPPLPRGQTVWTPFAAASDHFAPSALEMMINFVVDDLDGVLARATGEGAEFVGREDADQFGRFAWLLDPDGRKIELWEPGASA